METTDLLAVLRILVLVVCIAGAAKLDLWQRRVPNEYWIIWSQPLIFLLALELLVRGADWTLWLTFAGILAWLSSNVIGVPEVKALRTGAIEDWLVSIWYLVGAVGVIAGALKHGPAMMAMYNLGDPYAALWCAACDTVTIESQATIWMWLLGLSITIGFFDLAYRARLLHGGADAKALMLTALALPWWAGLPVMFWSGGPAGISLVPPALSLLIWTAVGFLTLPVMTLFRNIKRGDAKPFRLAWHAHRMELDEIAGKHVWLLEEVVEGADGGRSIETRMRPSRGSRAESEVERVIEELQGMGSTSAWVTSKHPFLVYLLPAIPLTVLLGDPVSLILGALGL